jgi:hypothetical protein
MKQSTYRLLGICLLLSFGVLFYSSPDSYTHDLYQRTDSANFYTSGKSLMSGLIPYVDFADSKGPLLWVIYGIGYLLSPHTYVGVFWLSVIMYTFVLYFVFKTAQIFLNDQKKSLFVVVLMLSCLFTPWFHYEVRSEDWQQFFIALAFYRICSFLYTEKGKENRSTYITCFLLGVCLIGTFFIKYNCTVMLGLTCLYMLYALFREHKNILLSFLSLVAGICVLALPWILYSLYVGCFQAFIHEYITNTLQTVSSNNVWADYIHEWLFLTYDTHLVLLFSSSCLGAFLLSRKVSNYNYFFLLSFIGFFAIAIHRCQFLHWYYIAVCLYFPIWLCIALVDLLSNRRFFSNPLWLKSVVLVTLIYTFFSNTFFWGFLTPTWFFRNSTARSEFYNASYYMSQIERPKVIYYLCGTLGLETPVDGLPATTYWTTQVGATTDMMDSQMNAMALRIADFIVAGDHNTFPIVQTDSLLQGYGYHPLMSFRTLETDFILYTKHQLKEPPSDFNVSNFQVLTKSRIFR